METALYQECIWIDQMFRAIVQWCLSWF